MDNEKLKKLMEEIDSYEYPEEITNLLDTPVMTMDEICEKYSVTHEFLDKQLAMGIKVEYEHSSNFDVMERIALAHLSEIPDYYTRLQKMEKDGKLQWNKK